MNFRLECLHARSHAIPSRFSPELLLGLFRWAEKTDFEYLVLKLQFLNHFEKVHFHAKKCLNLLYIAIC